MSLRGRTRYFHGGSVIVASLLFATGCDVSQNSPPVAPVAPTPSQSVSNSMSMEFVVFPGGAVRVGEPDQRKTIELESFHLAVHELTQKDYEQLVGVNPSRFRGDPLRPVDSVSWIDAIEFCNRLSEKECFAPYYEQSGTDGSKLDKDGRPIPVYRIVGGTGYRLPTVAEWEYAVGSSLGKNYCFGDDPSRLPDHAWFDDTARRTTHPVGSKASSEWGLHDAHGNVWEWCWDEYRPDSGRYAKGGSWSSSESECGRFGFVGAVSYLRSDTIGFRLARSPQ